MTKVFCFGSMLLALALVPGCQETKKGATLHSEDGEINPEAVTVALIAELNGAVAILHTVKDQRTARKAGPKLKAAALHLQKTLRRFNSLAQAPREEENRLRAKYKESLEEAVQRLSNEVDRIGAIPEADAILKDSLRDFDKIQGKAPK
jgi:hypothetical protein